MTARSIQSIIQLHTSCLFNFFICWRWHIWISPRITQYENCILSEIGLTFSFCELLWDFSKVWKPFRRIEWNIRNFFQLPSAHFYRISRSERPFKRMNLGDFFLFFCCLRVLNIWTGDFFFYLFCLSLQISMNLNDLFLTFCLQWWDFYDFFIYVLKVWFIFVFLS